VQCSLLSFSYISTIYFNLSSLFLFWFTFVVLALSCLFLHARLHVVQSGTAAPHDVPVPPAPKGQGPYFSFPHRAATLRYLAPPRKQSARLQAATVPLINLPPGRLVPFFYLGRKCMQPEPCELSSLVCEMHAGLVHTF